MDHAVLVGVVHRGADVSEQAEACGETELPAGDVAGDGLAVHELHGQPRLAGRQGAAIEQAHDVRMLQARQDRALRAKATSGVAVEERDARQLDRGLLGETPVRPLGAVDDAHAPLADDLDQAPGADRRPGARPRRAEVERRRLPFGGDLEKAAGGLVRVEQRHHLAAQVGMGLGACSREGAARARAQVERLGEDAVRLGPEFRRHGRSGSCGVVVSRARNSQARANAQWRFTVAGDTCRTSAVSSMDSPAK